MFWGGTCHPRQHKCTHLSRKSLFSILVPVRRPQAPFPAPSSPLEKGPSLACLTCPLQHVFNILRCPRHKAGLICVLQPEDEAPLVLLGKDIVVQGSAEAAQVQEAWGKKRTAQTRQGRLTDTPQPRSKQALLVTGCPSEYQSSKNCYPVPSF